MEKRRNLRLPLRISGQLSFGNTRVHQTETYDISLQGALVRDIVGGHVNQKCVLSLFIVASRIFSVTFEGWIVYADSRGCGIAFHSTSAEEFQAFTEFLQEHAQDPQAVRREIHAGQTPRLTAWEIL